MAIGSIGGALNRQTQRARDIARDRLMEGPENNQEGGERGRPRGPGVDLGAGDPTLNERGLVPGSTLDRLDRQIQGLFSGEPQDITIPTELPGMRPPNDEERGFLGPPPGPDEEEPLFPGDPNDLGARARRRRTIDEVNNPPLLRRGLLGV